MNDVAECAMCSLKIYLNTILKQWLHVDTGDSLCRWPQASPLPGTERKEDIG